MEKDKKRTLRKWPVLALLIFPFLCAVTVGFVFLEDTKLYSEEGLIFSVCSIAFAVLCWSIVVIYDFSKAYKEMHTRREKIVYSILLFFYFAFAVGYVLTTYWYISIGCEAAELEALEKAAIEAENLDLGDLPMQMIAKLNTLLTAKTICRVCRLFFFCLFITAPRVKKQNEAEDEKEEKIETEK